MSPYEKRWQAARQRIADAVRAAGRAPESVRLLAVSKTFPADAVRAVYALGQRAFGENYAQEAREKRDALGDLGGSRMAPDRAAAEQQGADRRRASTGSRPSTGPAIAERLSAARSDAHRPLDVLVQVNVSGEVTKSGVAPADALGSRGTWQTCRICACAASWASPSPRPTPGASARSSGNSGRASTPAGRGACRSTRFRWACRPTSNSRLPRARRKCGSGRRFSAPGRSRTG